jgi:hypothetical protein
VLQFENSTGITTAAATILTKAKIVSSTKKNGQRVSQYEFRTIVVAS